MYIRYVSKKRQCEEVYYTPTVAPALNAHQSKRKQEAKLSLGYPAVLPHSAFGVT